MDITGNVVFIPGATSGIGEALAIALLERGNTVIIGGRRQEQLDRIAAAHAGIDTVVIDTASEASIAEASAHVLERHPELNAVILMAGIMQAENWHGADDFVSTAERIVVTNLLGPIRVIGALIGHLQRQPRATIMTVSSGLAFTPLRVTPTYNATKAAIHQLSESIRLQLADTSVSVVELVPPAVQTTLMPGHEDNPQAMPLADFVDEVLTLLEAQPDATEIVVERVKSLRYSEVRGVYAETVAMLNGPTPRARAR